MIKENVVVNLHARTEHAINDSSGLEILSIKEECSHMIPPYSFIPFRWSGSLKNATLQIPRPFTNNRVGEIEVLGGRGV